VSPRERIINAIKRKKIDKIPKHAIFSSEVKKIFREKTRKDDPEEYFQMEVRWLAPPGKQFFGDSSLGWMPLKPTIDFRKSFTCLKNADFIDPWGVGHILGSFYHFTKMIHPMKEFQSVKEAKRYPFPVVADDSLSILKKQVNSLKREKLAVVGYGGCIFERGWYLRGMENLLVDIYFNKDFATFLLDKITDINCMVSKLLVRAGIDILNIGDDVGGQRGMLMDPKIWREWFKPRLKKVINSARKGNRDLLVFYHSDGNVTEIIPDLIELGVDVLNPVQPECMDLDYVYKNFGDQISFWGTVGTQTTLPFGSPQEVEMIVKERIEKYGKTGGLVIAPAHMIEPEVPWENILAFFEAIEKYGFAKSKK